jgi:hypothetical protein
VSKQPIQGNCYVCGEYGPLTQEHIPPKRAFNDRNVVLTRMLAARDEAEREFKQQHQGGHKQPVLCATCNNDTGAWYGTDYAHFAQLCAERAKPSLVGRRVAVDLAAVRPLRIFKQALTIICASSGPGVAGATPRLRDLILNPNLTGRPGNLRLFCFLVANVAGRATGVTGIGGLTRHFRIAAEFAWWPVGWVLAFNSEGEYPELCDLTHWGSYGYDERSSLTFFLPCWPISTSIPLDYRTPDQAHRDYRRNMTEQMLIKP